MKKKEKDHIPLLAKFWLRLYHVVPKVKFPGSDLDWGFTIASMCFFYSTRLMLQQVLHSYGWPVNSLITKQAAASLQGGLFHSPNLVAVAFVLMRSVSKYNPAAAQNDHPQWWQDVADAIIQLCTGHMLCDTIAGIFVDNYVPGQGFNFGDETVLFLAHHTISLLYLISTRVLRAGHQSMLMCFLLGETTNPTFSAYLVCQSAKTLECCSGPLATNIIRVVELVNAIVYIPFRAIIGPIVGAHMSYNILCSDSARTNIPIYIRLLWTAILWIIAIASIPYVITFMEQFKTHMEFMMTAAAADVQQEL